MEKPKYIIVYSDDVRILIKKVNKKLVKGYEPQGGLICDEDGDYCQAMIKWPEEPTN
jgi:hypothetical protein